MYDQIVASNLPLYHFRTLTDPGRGINPQTENTTSDEIQDEEGWIVCRQCRQRLTRPSHQISVNGSHRHSFANPSGIIFEIGCYAKAQGYQIWGAPSREFAWFAGYSWEIMICAKCSIHLGWLFSGSSGSHFYGLIMENLDHQG